MFCEAQHTPASFLLYRFQNRAGMRAAGSFVMVAPREWRCCMDATIYTLFEFGSFFYSIYESVPSLTITLARRWSIIAM